MTAPSEKSSARTPGKQVRQKSTLPKAKTRTATVGYAFSGSMAELPKAVEEGIKSERIRTVLIPGTALAADALKGSKHFSRVKVDGFLFDRPRSGKTRDAGRGVTRDVSDAHVGAEVFEPDARARAILCGRSYAAQDLKAAGGSYGLDEVRALLNDITRQAVDKRVTEGTLLAVPGPGGSRRFPTAQFDKQGVAVKGLKEVRKALGFSSPWAVLNFLVNGNDHLNGRRPIDALYQGEVGLVVAAAASVGVQGA